MEDLRNEWIKSASLDGETKHRDMDFPQSNEPWNGMLASA